LIFLIVGAGMISLRTEPQPAKYAQCKSSGLSLPTHVFNHCPNVTCRHMKTANPQIDASF
jgi:hypothetical protein